jgi:hypothetical protein
VASILFFILKVEKEDFGKSSVYLRMTTKGRLWDIKSIDSKQRTQLMLTLNRKYAKQILESWLDNNDPTAEYYVKSIPSVNRAVSCQQFNGKNYVCVLATLGGRSANEPFLVPRDFWDDMEKEINPPAKVQDGYPDFEI